jgi:hypothetical protein
MKKKNIYFDIDGTICVTKNSNYKKSKVKKRMIKIVNNLYKENTIVFYTARYMGRFRGNTKLVKTKYTETKNQLKKWGFKFDKLIMGKPSYDYLIDDKAHNIKDPFLKKLFK